MQKPRRYFIKDLSLWLIVPLLTLGFPAIATAQTLEVGHTHKQKKDKEKEDAKSLKNNPLIRNFRVVSKKTLSSGSIMKTIKYDKGNVTVTKMILLPPQGKGKNYHALNRKYINPNTLNHDSLMIYIDKKHYFLALLYKGKKIREYPAVFGPDRLDDKMMEGDRRTPEGWFRIASKKHDARWECFIKINYPNKTSYKRFHQRKKKGEIPRSARIGGNIGIHGTPPNDGAMVDVKLGWTDGCISLKPKDVLDLYRFVKPGDRVFIR